MKILASRQNDDISFLESLVDQGIWILVTWEPKNPVENMLGFNSKIYINLTYSGQTKFGGYYVNNWYVKNHPLGQPIAYPPYKLFNKDELHVVYPKEMYTTQEFCGGTES